MKQKKKNKKLYIKTFITVSLFFLVFNINISNISDLFDGKSSAESGFATLKNFFIIPSAFGQQGVEILEGQGNYENISGDSSWIVQGFNWILYGFFCFFSWMLGLSGFLFDWAVNAENIKHVLYKEAIYNAWKMVRDFLNLGFILILLYSAFCTVFQIEKYHLKKILLMLVLMALLVNFSFPISRFIVDASNVTMYFFLQSAFGDASTSFSAGFVKFTNITEILVPRDTKGNFDSAGSTTEIIMATFFVICLMISMFVIAAILIVRIVALAVLIIFSSIGFVAAVLPDTKTFANKWWSNLFKYAFAGPILVFMVLLALNLMKELAVEKTLEDMKADAVNYGSNPSKLANAAYFFIPIVLLWVGIFATRTMSIFGADWIVGKAKGAAKIIPRVPFKGAKFVADKTGVSGGAKEATDYYKKKGLPGRLGKIWGLRGTDKREESEAKFGGAFIGTGKGETPRESWREMKEGWKSGKDRARDKRTQEKVDENKKLNVSASQLNKDLDSADEVTKIAAAVTMTEKGLLTDIDRFEKALQAAGNDEDLKKKIIDKAPKDITKSAVTNSAELGRALTATTIKNADGSINTVKTGKMQEALKGKIKEDNSASILAEYDISKGKSNLDAYKDNFGNMSAEQLAKQKNIHDDAYLTKNPALRNYLDFKDNDYKQKVLSEMSSAGIDAWKKQKIV